MPPNVVDASIKALFRSVPEAVFHLAGVPAAAGEVQPADPSVPVTELRADQVFIHSGGPAGSPWAISLEYQWQPDPRRLASWLEKALGLQRHLRMPVLLVVVYLHRGRRATFPDAYRVEAGGMLNEHRFHAIRLWEHADRIRAGEVPELAPLLVLCEDQTPEVALRQERNLILGAPLEHSVRASLLAIAYLLGARYADHGLLAEVFREDLPMLKDAGIISEWLEESRREAMAEGMAAGKAEGMAAGKAEGMAAGRAEGMAAGRAEEARRLTLEVLRDRFGKLPADLERRIQSSQPEDCERLLRQAMEATTLADLDA